MDFEFGFSRVFCPGSDPVENAIELEFNINRLVQRNLTYLRYHAAPSLYHSRVVYGRTKIWLDIGRVLELGHADCKSLSSWRIAEMVHNKLCKMKPKPVFRWKLRPDGSGISDYHILIQTENGYECPSKTLGMGQQYNL